MWKTVLFQTIQFSISTQFKCKYSLLVKNISISSFSCLVGWLNVLGLTAYQLLKVIQRQIHLHANNQFHLKQLSSARAHSPTVQNISTSNHLVHSNSYTQQFSLVKAQFQCQKQFNFNQFSQAQARTPNVRTVHLWKTFPLPATQSSTSSDSTHTQPNVKTAPCQIIQPSANTASTSKDSPTSNNSAQHKHAFQM